MAEMQIRNAGADDEFRRKSNKHSRPPNSSTKTTSALSANPSHGAPNSIEHGTGEEEIIADLADTMGCTLPAARELYLATQKELQEIEAPAVGNNGTESDSESTKILRQRPAIAPQNDGDTNLSSTSENSSITPQSASRRTIELRDHAQEKVVESSLSVGDFLPAPRDFRAIQSATVRTLLRFKEELLPTADEADVNQPMVGGFCSVFHTKIDDQEYAIKCSNFSHIDFHEALLREVKILEALRLRAPELFPIAEELTPLFSRRDVFAIREQWIPTKITPTYLKNLTLNQRLDLFEDMAQCVHHLHQIGYIHDDLKLDSFRISSEGRANLVDLSGVTGAKDETPVSRKIRLFLARSSIAFSVSMNQKGARAISPLFLSPETAAGNPPLPQSDVHHLGRILSAILRGGSLANTILPLEGDLHKFNPVIFRALAEDPQARPQSAIELLEQLRKIRETKPIDPSETGLLQQTFSNDRKREESRTIRSRMADKIASGLKQSPELRLGKATTAQPSGKNDQVSFRQKVALPARADFRKLWQTFCDSRLAQSVCIQAKNKLLEVAPSLPPAFVAEILLGALSEENKEKKIAVAEIAGKSSHPNLPQLSKDFLSKEPLPEARAALLRGIQGGTAIAEQILHACSETMTTRIDLCEGLKLLSDRSNVNLRRLLLGRALNLSVGPGTDTSLTLPPNIVPSWVTDALLHSASTAIFLQHSPLDTYIERTQTLPIDSQHILLDVIKTSKGIGVEPNAQFPALLKSSLKIDSLDDLAIPLDDWCRTIPQSNLRAALLLKSAGSAEVLNKVIPLIFSSEIATAIPAIIIFWRSNDAEIRKHLWNAASSSSPPTSRVAALCAAGKAEDRQETNLLIELVKSKFPENFASALALAVMKSPTVLSEKRVEDSDLFKTFDTLPKAIALRFVRTVLERGSDDAAEKLISYSLDDYKVPARVILMAGMAGIDTRRCTTVLTTVGLHDRAGMVRHAAAMSLSRSTKSEVWNEIVALASSGLPEVANSAIDCIRNTIEHRFCPGFFVDRHEWELPFPVFSALRGASRTLSHQMVDSPRNSHDYNQELWDVISLGDELTGKPRSHAYLGTHEFESLQSRIQWHYNFFRRVLRKSVTVYGKGWRHRFRPPG